MFFKTKPFAMVAHTVHDECLEERKRFFLFGPMIYVVSFNFGMSTLFYNTKRKKVYFDKKEEALWFYRKLITTQRMSEITNIDIEKELESHFMKKLV